MTMLTMLLMISSVAFTMFMSLNPISLGVMILLMALLLAISFAMSMSSWVAFLIFLIYIGGMLVMFTYFVAIIPNQNLSMTHTIIMMITSVLSLLLISNSLNITPMINQPFDTQINILYTQSNIQVLIMLASILLLTMVIVVKITTLSKGPMRPFNYV